MDDIKSLFEEWKRLHCGPREMARLLCSTRRKRAFSAPWLWWSHYGVAKKYMTKFQAAKLATIFVWAFIETPQCRVSLKENLTPISYGEGSVRGE